VVTHKKPAPDIYREAVKRLGTLPECCIAFEDSTAGVASARAAGCYVVATPSEWLAGDDLHGAHLQVPHLGDPGQLWEAEHALLRRRWVSVKDLVTWHARHQPGDAPQGRTPGCVPGVRPRVWGAA
jgi:FMN phosphatase YigB (HAD superfamily)